MMRTFLPGLLLGAALLGGCAGASHDTTFSDEAPSAADLQSIRYEAGPCHGFCPVYSVEVLPDGTTIFNGLQHTSIYGKQARQNGPQAFTRLRHELAAWQPMLDQHRASSDCGPRATDMSQYTVTWTASNGRQAVLIHDGGCRSASARSLRQLLDEQIPRELGIADWIDTPSTGRTSRLDDMSSADAVP